MQRKRTGAQGIGSFDLACLFCEFRCDARCAAACGLCKAGRIFDAAKGRVAEGGGEVSVEEDDAVRAVEHEVTGMDAGGALRRGRKALGQIDVFFVAVQFFHRPRGGEPGEESLGGVIVGGRGGEGRAVHGEADAHGSEAAAHGKGLREGGMVLGRAGGGAAAGEGGPRQTRLFKAVHPALDGFLRPFQCFRRIVGGGGEEIDVAEVVFRGKEGIHPVEEGLQLAGDAVVVNGGRRIR